MKLQLHHPMDKYSSKRFQDRSCFLVSKATPRCFIVIPVLLAYYQLICRFWKYFFISYIDRITAEKTELLLYETLTSNLVTCEVNSGI